MQHPFGTVDQEVFTYSLFLVLCNRLVSCLTSVVCIAYEGRYSELRPVAPVFNYAAVSLSNVIATTCQYEALKHLSFAVQTLGKCAKMFPVMIWGFFVFRKRYTTRDFTISTLITLGCTLFVTTGEYKSATATKNSSLYGAGLMMTYLVFDGFTSSFQDKMFKGYSMTTYNQILYTTLWSAALSLFGLMSSGQLPAAFGFLTRHPEALTSILVLSLAATAGSLFISYTIKTFGALVFAQIMTTRQFISIQCSNIVFRHSLTRGQWGATAVIFATLYYQGATKKAHTPGKTNGNHSPAGAVSDDAQQPLLKVSVEGKE